jgi:hypothetical protein
MSFILLHICCMYATYTYEPFIWDDVLPVTFLLLVLDGAVEERFALNLLPPFMPSVFAFAG